jgi:hypothetical protein
MVLKSLALVFIYTRTAGFRFSYAVRFLRALCSDDVNARSFDALLLPLDFLLTTPTTRQPAHSNAPLL